MKRHAYVVLSVFLLASCNYDDAAVKHTPPKTHEEVQHGKDLGKDNIDSRENNNGNISDPNSREVVTEVNGQLVMNDEYFNDIVVKDNKKVIQNPENFLAIVNKEFSLPSTYKPTDLVKVKVPVVYESAEENYMRKEAAEALKEMFDAAKAENIQLYALSGYRSYQTQKVIFEREVKNEGYEKAALLVAKPGTSEHQTGLTMDITAKSVNMDLNESFGETKEGIWLKENAHKYGYILRYPKGKENITQYSYEPWHFRYVGKDVAKVIYEKGWTFEEFIGAVKKM